MRSITDLIKHVEDAVPVAWRMKCDVVEYRKRFYHLHTQLF
jgi:hypothetical protein